MVDVAVATVRYEGDLTNLEAANRKAKAGVKDAAADMANSTKTAGKATQSLTDKAVKVFAALGAVEAGLKLADAAAKVFTGDLKGATDALKTLPFGIGPALGALESFLGTITGINAEIAESQELLKELTEQGSRLDQAAALLTKIVSERGRIGKSPEEIAAINIREETELRVKALKDLGRTEREIGLARELGAKKLLEIERTQRKERDQAMAASSQGAVVATSISGFQAKRALDDPRILQTLELIAAATQVSAQKEGLT